MNPYKITFKRLIATTLTLVLICTTSFGIGVYSAHKTAPKIESQVNKAISQTNPSLISSTLDEVEVLVAGEGLFPIDTNSALGPMIQSLLKSSQDPYADWLSPEDTQALEAQIANNYSGMGFDTVVQSNVIYVANVLENSAAAAAGLRPGDALLELNGIPLKGSEALFEAAKSLNLENPLLKLQRGPSQELEKKLKVISYHEPDVTYKLLRDKLAYIDLNTFSQSTAPALKKALARAKADEARGIIFDVRFNFGGYMEACYLSLSYLTDSQIIAYETKKDTSIPILKKAPVEIQVPYAVLINQDTYSAAELFAQSLSAYENAKLFGVTTYGKGLQQSLFTSSTGTIKLSTAYFSATQDSSFQGIGIQPHFEVITDYKNYQKDQPLEAAIRFLTLGLSP